MTTTPEVENSHRKRVLIISNKWWECNPVMNVLLNDNARPAAELGWPQLLHYPCNKHEQSYVSRTRVLYI